MFNPQLKDQLQALGFRELCYHGNKRGQLSEGAAWAMIRSVYKEQERKPDKKQLGALSPYFCRHCQLWYIGHSRVIKCLETTSKIS